MLGESSQVCEGQDKVTFANKGGRNRDEEEWYIILLSLFGASFVIPLVFMYEEEWYIMKLYKYMYL